MDTRLLRIRVPAYAQTVVHVRAVLAAAPRLLVVVLAFCLTGARADGGHLLVVRSSSTSESAVLLGPSLLAAAAGSVVLAPRGSKAAGELHRSIAAAKTAAGVHAPPLGGTYLDLPSPPDHVALRSCRRSGRSPPAV